MRTNMVLFIIFLIAAACIAWGIYLLAYRHPADYTEGTVTIYPSGTAGRDIPPAASSSPAAPSSSARTAGAPVKSAGDKSAVTIDGHVFMVDLADTIAKRAQGLSGRERLEENQGMLFLFSAASRESFWMKDMKFPIDIIWISGSTIVDISENVPAPQPGQSIFSLPQYSPSSAVDKVLEIDAGLAARFGFKTGDKAAFLLPGGEVAQ